MRDGVLRPAARHPVLKGSRFVGSRGVRDLYVCLNCGSMWQTWFDQREGCQCWRNHGPSIVPIFAADTSLARLVEWVASDYSAASFGLVDTLVTKLIRRRPEGLDGGMSALFRELGKLTPPKDADFAERIPMLFHLLALVVERAIRGDLRPEGPREKPPTRYRDAEVEEAARRFRAPSVDDLTRLARTHDVVRRLMWESRWEEGSESPDRAVIALHDPSAVLCFLEELPLDVVDDGIQRGVYAESAFKDSRKLHNLGRLPENDHAIWMPHDAWVALERILDPLHRLAASIRRIRTATGFPSSERLARLQMESLLVKEPLRNGARFTNSARCELEEIARELRTCRGGGEDRAHEALLEILQREQAAADSDAQCVLAKS